MSSGPDKAECRGWRHLDPHWWLYPTEGHKHRICRRCGMTEKYHDFTEPNQFTRGWEEMEVESWITEVQLQAATERRVREILARPQKPVYHAVGLAWLRKRRSGSEAEKPRDSG